MARSCVNINKGIKDRLDVEAFRDHRSLTNFVEKVLMDHLDRLDAERRRLVSHEEAMNFANNVRLNGD